MDSRGVATRGGGGGTRSVATRRRRETRRVGETRGATPRDVSRRASPQRTTAARRTGGTPWKWAHGDLDEDDATTEATLEARAATEARRRDATTTVFARDSKASSNSPRTVARRFDAARCASSPPSPRILEGTRRDASSRRGAAKALFASSEGGSETDPTTSPRGATPWAPSRHVLAAAETCSRPMLGAGALEMVALFARNARDAASLRAAAAAAANLCGGGEVDVAGDAEANGSARPAGRNSSSASSINRATPRSVYTEVRAHAALRRYTGGTRGRAEVARRRGRDASRRRRRRARAEPATARRAAKALCLMASSEEGAAEVRGMARTRAVERVAKEAGRGSAARRPRRGAMAERITESAEELATDSCDRARQTRLFTRRLLKYSRWAAEGHPLPRPHPGSPISPP